MSVQRAARTIKDPVKAQREHVTDGATDGIIPRRKKKDSEAS